MTLFEIRVADAFGAKGWRDWAEGILRCKHPIHNEHGVCLLCQTVEVWRKEIDHGQG